MERTAWMLAAILFLFVFGIGTVRAQSSSVSSNRNDSEGTVRGIVTDASNGLPLPGANVLLRDSTGSTMGSVSNRDGFYLISGLAPGAYRLQASFIGFEAYTDTLIVEAGARITRHIALVPATGELNEVVIAAESGAGRMRAGLQTVRAAGIRRIPAPDAGGDLASWLQSLPGVVALGDRGGQLFVRGGTPAQNLVLVDGLPVWQPFHIVGFFSAFPHDLVSNADFYAGGFGARYSGRISSVVDVTMREGNAQRFAGAASISPFLASMRIEGPLRKEKVSFLGSARMSVIEQAAPVFLAKSLPLRFGDMFLKLTSSGSTNSRCSLSALHTFDRGAIDVDNDDPGDVFRWSNTVAGGRCIAFPANTSSVFELVGGVSYFNNAVEQSMTPERASDAVQISTKVNLTTPVRGRQLRVGAFARANWLEYTLGEQFQNVRADSDLLISAGAYAELETTIGNSISVTPGLSATFYPTPYKSVVEPRLRFSWRQHADQTFHAALGLYRQTITGINDERDAGSVFTAWVPAPVDGAQAKAVHLLIGWERQIGNALRLAAEGYHKRLRDIPVPILSAIARFTTPLTLADGTVYGTDIRLEFQRGPLYGYAGYGLANTSYHAPDGSFGTWFDENIARYNPPHDRRHQVSAVLGMEIRKFTANIRWQFGSGLPFTRVLGFDDIIALRTLVDVREAARRPRVLFERPWNARLPTYHRLDLSLERRFDISGAPLSLQAGAINAYDRTNLFYFDVFRVRRVDQLPIVPFVALKIERL
ncbi:MAG: TonB-dependent receptor plug domain-containing protein [Bacteroidetes bacterium SB0662_bin_6]|nr:TonB-dependent receptor plug domain-containing protein [Bacteroidetes bacterium SB0668_bin_1]MYE04286.1 TonB-dependent receptor plug domain-containing protein [Bacteroidetes bacterium SB0662_bin_6]